MTVRNKLKLKRKKKVAGWPLEVNWNWKEMQAVGKKWIVDFENKKGGGWKSNNKKRLKK